VKATADVFEVFGEPGHELVRGAIEMFCGERLSDSDAARIAEAGWKDLRALFRRGRSVRQSLQRLGTTSAKREMDRHKVTETDFPSLDGVGIEHLHGYGEAADWGRKFVQDVKDHKAGKISWQSVERGLLLYGVPGTGKTRFAEALAVSCQVPLVFGSYASWQARGHQGDMLKAMRAAFDAARQQAPCILLIDELESFLDRSKDSDHADYIRPIVNGLLELLDGADRREGVIVIGTTNFPKSIDPAILRPGRIGKHVEVLLPDGEARRLILEQYLQWTVPEEHRADLALATEGLSGADLEDVARQVWRDCRMAGRQIDIEVVNTHLPNVIAMPAERLKTSAIHESGHVLVGLAAGRTILDIRVIDRYREGVGRYNLGGVTFQQVPVPHRTPDYFIEEMMISLAGMAAEMEIIGAHGDGSGGLEDSDLVNATDTATYYEAVFGMGETMVSEVLPDRKRLARIRQNPILWTRIDALLKRQLATTRTLVAENRGLIEALADHLVNEKRLSGNDLKQFLVSNGFATRLDNDPSPTQQ
jgi:ATP-dependent Zn protease